MPTLEMLIAIGIAVLVIALGIAAKRMTLAWLRFRGRLIVVCPADEHGASVSLNTARAVLTAAGGNPDLLLSGCSHWPERAGCGQSCLSQISATPQNCR